jgi:DNA mismatch endonuclease (patch repair protein)
LSYFYSDIFQLPRESSKMADLFTREQRSWVMARIKAKNTKPEIIVRKMLHAMGCRFRIHQKNLPGVPDIVLKKHKIVIFVHGCFWHQHPGCKRATMPKTRVEYWQEKLTKNVTNFGTQKKELELKGWKVFVVWECETKNKIKLFEKLTEFFKADENDF